MSSLFAELKRRNVFRVGIAYTLGRAIDDNWRTYWWYYLERDPVLDGLRDEPEFQEMVDEVREDMAEQLVNVREMEARGEIIMPAALSSE